MKKGLVHIYTGPGKGKTTAAIGLAVRAAGAGMRVLIQQFIKGMPYSELKTIRGMRSVTLRQCGRRCFIRNEPSAKDLECAVAGWKDVVRDIASRRYDLVILDEVNVAMDLGLVDPREVSELIRAKPARTELVLTGRDCPRELYDQADYVTEMHEVKHPYTRGVKARKGIEH